MRISGTFWSTLVAWGSCLLLIACGGEETPIHEETDGESASVVHTPPSSPIDQDWKAYWYQGKAELTSYHLEQARYGEMREGLAVTVFVTEDFSKSRYVKLDYPDQAAADRVPVLKFNLNKRFHTGIYEYTLMQSVFTPVHRDVHPKTLRVTSSNIEWCGQFLTSTRLRENGYEVQYQSYFDGEEDLRLELPAAMLEDEVWNLIRIDPSALPIGDTLLIPSILTQELTHERLAVERAICQLTTEEGVSTYTMTYPRLSRILSISFETAFPRPILRWEETFKSVSGWGMETKVMSTRATRIAQTMTDYWEKKYLRHEAMRRDSLGLIDCPPTGI